MTFKRVIMAPGLSWRKIIVTVLALLLVGAFAGLRGADAIGRPELKTALLATVRVAVPVENSEDTYSTGSGTVLTADGYILTNFHVMGDVDKETLYNSDGIAFIGVNPNNLRGEPVWKYQARYIRGDPVLDLAVLKVVGLLDDAKAPLPKSLGLTPIPMGDSDVVMIGDELNVVGFPSIAQGSVTFTDGKIAGFLDEDHDGEIDWFKTDAKIARGNSGGLAADANGQLIGIPTIVIADTETASNIGLVRPVAKALALIRAAQNQADTNQKERDSTKKRKATGPQVENVRFAAAVDRKSQPIDPSFRFDLDTNVVYAVFDYLNFRDGASFQYIWYQDGFEMLNDSFKWEDGKQGGFWVNIHSKTPLPQGFYELELLLDGDSLNRGGFVVGDEKLPQNGAFGPITFAAGVTDNNEPIKPGETFSDVKEIYAFFDVEDVPNGALWTRRWYVDGELALEKEGVWDGGSASSWWISLTHAKGLPVGRYRLELLIEDEVVQKGEFEIVEAEDKAKKPQGVQVVGEIVEEDNRRNTIKGATVFFLQPGISVSKFLKTLDESMIYATGISDWRGDYQLDKLVMPGESYGVVVYHEKYQLVTEDDYLIAEDATSPWVVNVLMSR